MEAALAGLALTTLAGVGLGVGFVRLGRVPFAVATWLFAWLVALGLAAFPSIGGGADGIAIADSGLGDTGHYVLALALVVLACLAFFAIARGAPGLALSALRQRRAAALALGVRATRLRLGAFVASAALGGLAGSLGVQLQGIADPGAYDPFLSFKLLAAVLIGGMTAALGAVAGLAALQRADAALALDRRARRPVRGALRPDAVRDPRPRRARPGRRRNRAVVAHAPQRPLERTRPGRFGPARSRPRTADR